MRFFTHYSLVLFLLISGAAKGQVLDYGATEFCKFSPANPTPVTATPGGGTFSSNSANLVVNPTTGEIDLNASIIGGPYMVTYTVGLSSANASMFIVDAPVVTLAYPNTQLCMTPLPPPSQRQPSSFGPPGGTFSISPAATGLSINASTGLLSFNAATPQGTYTITYTVNQAGCIDSETFDINLFQPVANPTLSYPQASYCQLEADPSPTFTPAGGTFSAIPAGLSINASTGIIDLSASAGGVYTITYTVGNLCGNKTANFNLTVIAEPANPTLSYPQASYCKSDANPSPTFSPAGGTFSAMPAGLVINASTGVVDIAGSTTGSYTITYSVGVGLCNKTTNTNFTLNPNPVITTFTYLSNTYCQNDPNPSPTVNPAGGSFASTAGLSINASSGLIDLATSTAGTYNVSYTITALGCSTTQNFSVTVNPAPAVPTLAYSQATYCVNDSPSTPTFTPAGGTFSAIPAGLSLNASTGVITPSTSSTGSYTITYMVTLGSCSRQITAGVTINPNPVITTFNYSSNTYCQNDPNPSPTVNPVGGSFASTAGLSINASSGLINLAASTTGTYNVSYTVTSGGCSTTQNFSVTINPAPAVPTLSYSQAAYCVNDSPSTPTFTPAGGTFSAAPAGLSLNTSTGIITPSTSSTGSYTITYIVTLGSCSRQITANVTINPNPVITTFNYSSNTFCQNDPNPNPTVNPAGGTFSATPAGLSINTGTGIIDLASSTTGSYTVSYTVTASGCSTTQNFSVTVNPAPAVPTLAYSQATYCVNDSPSTPTFTPAGGTFSAIPAGLSLNASTGEITPSTSSTGSYTITYMVTLGSCSRQITAGVTINPNPVITTFNYSSNTFCQNDPNPSPTVNPMGGSFASTAGLSINSSSGLINLAASTTGTYNVSYTVTSGGCSTTQNFSVTINPLPLTPTVSYPQASYCSTATNPSPTTSQAGGVFSATPAGLSINAGTGIIDLASSTAGSYTVTYTLTNGCGSSNGTFGVTIVTTPTTPTVSYPQASYCTTDANPSPTVSQAGGTFSATPAGLNINASTGVITLSGSTAGSYTITYTLANGSCTSSNTFALAVIQTPANPTTTNGTRCGAGSVVLTASGGTNGNYRWYEPDGTTLIAGETNSTYTTPNLVVASTTYFVSLVNGSCESARVPVQALVQLTPTTITVTGVVTDVTTCNPATSGAVNISISGGTAPYTFTWSNGATTEDLSSLVAGSYTVTVRDFFNCQSVASSFIVGTNVPVLTLAANASSLSINQGETTNLSLAASQTLVNAVWSPAEGLSDVGSVNPTASPSQTTTYTVTATDNRGCTATSQVTIEVFGSELFVPNAFTPQSIDPKSQTFRVFGNGIGEISLRVFDKLGQVVYETSSVSEATTTGWNGIFNGKELPMGVFTWELTGKYLTGTELSFKGKKTGTVLLVR